MNTLTMNTLTMNTMPSLEQAPPAVPPSPEVVTATQARDAQLHELLGVEYDYAQQSPEGEQPPYSLVLDASAGVQFRLEQQTGVLPLDALLALASVAPSSVPQ